MSHSIVGRKQATKECTACHAAKSILHRPVDLNSSLPHGVPITYRGKNMNVVNYQSKEPTFDNQILLSSFYIIGNSRTPWVEWFGWLSVAGTILFGFLHATLRMLKGRL